MIRYVFPALLIVRSAHAEQFLYLPLEESRTLTCDFCCRDYPIPGRCHGAIDYRAPNGTPILAAADGEVVRTENRHPDRPNLNDGLGNHIRIRHSNGYLTIYAHLTRNSITVNVGDRVVAGQQIALSDNSGYSTGPHLHFEVRDPDGQRVNPYGDPPDYEGGCGPNALWATCPPVPWNPAFADADEDGYTVAEGDCDEEDPDINPAAEERCDGVDNDCSGAADEAFVEAGLFTRCSIGIGGCRTSGTWICTAEGDGLFCTAPPVGVPRPELCDGQDNDCNDVVDDGDAPASCDNGIFCDGQEVCLAGRCELGEPIVCNDGVDCTIDVCVESARVCSTVAAHERCDDGIDCTVDRCGPRGCSNSSSPDFDADRDGFFGASCAGGTDCNDSDPAINPGAEEVCDGVDNDCDEVVDDGVLNACGECGPAPEEACDGEDNDCDGSIDEGAPDCWRSVSLINAPSARSSHTAIWTGSEMMVWGGWDESLFSNTGRRYNPATNTWTAISTTNAPSARLAHTAIWTGEEMIVWGGNTASGRTNTGRRYDPATNTWTAISTTNAPSARSSHTAIWTGSEMVVWGGWDGSSRFNTGRRYNPATNTWTAISTTNAPSARSFHTAIWTGSEMMVWGGWDESLFSNTGRRYNPATNTWTATSTANTPSARSFHTAIWTGSEMIVWGGGDESSDFNTGGRYNPATNTWTATSTADAPSARDSHTAIWTGEEMIVWGGMGWSSDFNTGGRYDPVANTWTATSTANTPSARSFHTAIWTGEEMIVWGGGDESSDLNTGGRYTPP